MEDPPKPQPKLWYPRCITYDPLKAGSVDGTDTVPHDKAVRRAMKAYYKPNHKVVGIPENTIFVARLDRKTTEEKLKELFSLFGEIVRCRLVRDIITGISKCYAFIEYKCEAEAALAVNGCWRGQTLDGRVILVDYECERLLPGWVPRRLGGGFGGKKESGQLRFGGKEKPFVKPIYLMDEREIKRQRTKRFQNAEF